MKEPDGGCWPGYFAEAGTPRVVNPPYRPGDILWVRETWAVNNITPHDPEWLYKADYDYGIEPYCDWKWHPSIHMPKEAARIFLRVKDVRVERLQKITDVEAQAEGFTGEPCDHQNMDYHGCTDCMNSGWLEPPAIEFAELWDSTIKKADISHYGWDANPWVWVIEFERCEKQEGWGEND